MQVIHDEKICKIIIEQNNSLKMTGRQRFAAPAFSHSSIWYAFRLNPANASTLNCHKHNKKHSVIPGWLQLRNPVNLEGNPILLKSTACACVGLKFIMADSIYDIVLESMFLDAARTSSRNIPNCVACKCIQHAKQAPLVNAEHMRKQSTQALNYSRHDCAYLDHVGVTSGKHVAQQNAGGPTDQRLIWQLQNTRRNSTQQCVCHYWCFDCWCASIHTTCKQGHDNDCEKA